MRLSLSVACVGFGASLVFAVLPAHASSKSNVLFLAVSSHGNTSLSAIAIQCPDRADQHPYGEITCAIVDAVDGDFDRLPGNPRLCTKEYDPVTATMNGLWRNRPIGWQKTYSNACMLDARTGPIFRF
ncbi:SSI family serine proteinase inhibitor [Nonomuraea sp. ZG12]|uniref:SSI family serine proteinase inhibitor n=1 Tax=Nonomuraea sp. ZG12 TaxID=3452207 RepID=UPI003F8B3521